MPDKGGRFRINDAEYLAADSLPTAWAKRLSEHFAIVTFDLSKLPSNHYSKVVVNKISDTAIATTKT